jgi:hypothetical protein
MNCGLIKHRPYRTQTLHFKRDICGLLNLALLSPGIVSVLFFSLDYGSDAPGNR